MEANADIRDAILPENEPKPLMKLMVKAVALQIQGREVEEIRKTFKIEDAEELQKLKDENSWAYETKEGIFLQS